jgi:hypothetical protein
MELLRASHKPDARWMRHGDRYCSECELVIPREQLVEGWPVERVPCPKHRTTAAKRGVT